MDADLTEDQLQKILQKGSQQPLTGLDQRSLDTACFLSSLSQHVHSLCCGSADQANKKISSVTIQHKSGSNHSQLGVCQARLLSKLPAGLTECSVWDVQRLGTVIVYSECKRVQEVLSDIDFSPEKLRSTNAMLHGSIYDAAVQAVGDIQTVHQAAQGNSHARPIFLTGMSTGGHLGCQHIYKLLQAALLRCCINSSSMFMFMFTSFSPRLICRPLHWRCLCQVCISAHAGNQQGAGSVCHAWRALHLWRSSCGPV